jgi:hypothetical protein
MEDNALDISLRQAILAAEPGLEEKLETDRTVKKLQPLTAFDEMEALERAGREGWHSISFGMLYHLVEKTDEQWQHLRVLATSSRSSLEADGWRRIGRMWFPWAYYARNTGRKAELSPDGIE